MPTGYRPRTPMNLGGMSLYQLAIETWNRLSKHDAMNLAAAGAYYAMLATVPFITIIVVGTVLRLPDLTGVDPRATGLLNMTVEQLEDILKSLFPEEGYAIVRDQIVRIQSEPPLGLLSVSGVVALWSASSLFLVVIDALNRTYGVTDSRSWIKLRLTAMAMTMLEAACLLGSLVAIIAWPQVVRIFGLNPDDAVGWVATLAHWTGVFVMVLLSFALTFYAGPDIRHPWVWVTPGSLAGTIAFMVFCNLFRAYVQHFGSYNKSLGAVGGVMVLLAWYWVVAMVFMAAAEMDRVIEDGARTRGERRRD
jgi:membrane protein